MSTEVRNANEQAGIEPPRLADGHIWKLRATCTVLVFWVVVFVAGLGALVYYHQDSSSPQSWALSALVAGLGGVLGGVARALYFFSFDSYAFNHRLRTLKSSEWALSVCPKLDDRFDPLWVWYLWCLKPAVGAMVGLLLALTIELGLISLGAGEGVKDDVNLRLLVLGGLGGFFSEGLLRRVRSSVEGDRS